MTNTPAKTRPRIYGSALTAEILAQHAKNRRKDGATEVLAMQYRLDDAQGRIERLTAMAAGHAARPNSAPKLTLEQSLHNLEAVVSKALGLN